MNTEPTAVAQLQADMSLNPASPEAMEVQRGYRIGMDEQEPFRPDCFPSHEELEELGLPDIVKERIKLQRSLLEEKHRMYMFEKNYLQSAALYCHGNILAGYRYKPGPPKGPTTPRFSFSDATMKKTVMRMERKLKAEMAASAVEHKQVYAELTPDHPF